MRRREDRPIKLPPPPAMANKKTRQLQIRLTYDEHEKLFMIAAEQGIGVSDLVRDWIERLPSPKKQLASDS